MEDTPEEMYAIAVVMTVLATLAVILRLHARRLRKMDLAWDDYTMILALVMPSNVLRYLVDCILSCRAI